MEKKYTVVLDVSTGVQVEREYTKEEYAQAALDEGLNGEAPPTDS
jgi:hypothetical protein